MGNDFQVDPARARLIGIEYQRNGVCGRGFNTVDFEYDGERLIGVVYDDPEATAVLMPADLTRHFRGADYFGPWLREQVRIWEHIRYGAEFCTCTAELTSTVFV